MEILKIVLPILVGAFIGYCTNYIAIKMLFHPKREIRIGGFRLPFTPGVIPKNQPRIAETVGKAVGEQLFTKEDILRGFREGGAKETFAKQVADKLVSSETAWQEFGDLSVVAEGAGSCLGTKLVSEVETADLLPIIRGIGTNALANFLANPMIAMFLGESMLEGIYVKMSDSIKEYVREHGEELVSSYINKELPHLGAVTVGETLSALSVEEAMIEAVVAKVFDHVVDSMGDGLLASMNVRDVVRDKINEMSVEQLEELTMAVLKQELQTVINLGALIGAVIGIINVFI